MMSPLRLRKGMQTGHLCRCLVQTRPLGFLVLLLVQQCIVFPVVTDSQEERMHGSVLMQCARALDLWMKCMPNHMFATARERKSTRKFWR